MPGKSVSRAWSLRIQVAAHLLLHRDSLPAAEERSSPRVLGRGILRGPPVSIIGVVVPAAPSCENPRLERQVTIAARAPGSSPPGRSRHRAHVRYFAAGGVQQEGALDLPRATTRSRTSKPHPRWSAPRSGSRATRPQLRAGGRRMDVAARGLARGVLQPGRAARLPDSRSASCRRGALQLRATRRRGSRSCSRCWARTAPASSVPAPELGVRLVRRARGQKGRRPADRAARVPARREGARPPPRREGSPPFILNNPHTRPGRVYPRSLVEELVRVAVKHRVYVLYDSVYQRLDYVGWFVNPAFANTRVARLGRDAVRPVEDGHVRGLDAGRACWLVISDDDPLERVKARDILANLSPGSSRPLDPRPGLALAALQSPSPRCAVLALHARAARLHGGGRRRSRLARRRADRLRRDVLLAARVPRARRRALRPRLRHGVREKPWSEDSGGRLRVPAASPGAWGASPFVAFTGGRRALPASGTWQRLFLRGRRTFEGTAVFIDRVPRHPCRTAASARATPADLGPASGAHDGVWESVCTAAALRRPRPASTKAFVRRRKRFLEDRGTLRA